MAPFKKLTKKDASLQQKPWITRGILISMNKHDIFYKDFVTEKTPATKERIGSLYKSYRNLIVTLIRKSKTKYYADFFEEHLQKMKKPGMEFVTLLMCQKKHILI